MTKLLTVFIPTHNRPNFLKNCLQHHADFFIENDFEVIVADSSDSDESKKVCAGYSFIRYLNFKGTPAKEKCAKTILKAQGKYTLYLADDDYLIEEEVLKNLDYMSQHPDITALYAPWYEWNDKEKKAGEIFYRLPADKQYTRKKAVRLLEDVLGYYIYPEIFFARTDIYQEACLMDIKDYTYVNYLAVFLQRGTVYFSKTPFYYQTVAYNPLINPEKKTSFASEGMKNYAEVPGEIRRGLEFFATRCYIMSGQNIIPTYAKEKLNARIQKFYMIRLFISSKTALKAENYDVWYQFIYTAWGFRENSPVEQHIQQRLSHLDLYVLFLIQKRFDQIDAASKILFLGFKKQDKLRQFCASYITSNFMVADDLPQIIEDIYWVVPNSEKALLLADLGVPSRDIFNVEVYLDYISPVQKMTIDIFS